MYSLVVCVCACVCVRACVCVYVRRDVNVMRLCFKAASMLVGIRPQSHDNL